MMKHLMQVCGFQYAMTFQRMFMDKTLSLELANDFKKWEREREQRVGAMMEVVGDFDGGRGGSANAAGGAGAGSDSRGHGRRKSDSAIEFVETESGHVTPKSISPKLSQGMRFIGLHDASPLQMLLSKRVFADKSKKYKVSEAMGGGGGAGPAAGGSGAIPTSASAVLDRGMSGPRADRGNYHRAHVRFLSFSFSFVFP